MSAAAAAAVELAMTLAQNGARARQISRVRQLKMCSKRIVCPRLDQTEVPPTVVANSTQRTLVFHAQSKCGFFEIIDSINDSSFE